jgi:hypothetical protein
VTAGEDVNIQLAHQDVAVLDAAAERLKGLMEAMEGVVEIAGSLKGGKLE